MSEGCDICSNKCFGILNYHGSCCNIENRDYIIGPHLDVDDFLKRLSEKFGRTINRTDVFIDFQEGKKIFPDKICWVQPQNYPALKLDFHKSSLPCIFYNTYMKCCSVYEIRPHTCQNFTCDYLSQNF